MHRNSADQNRKRGAFIFYTVEALFFAALIILIVCIVSSGRTADMDIERAAGALLEVMDSESMQEENALKLRDRFGLSESDYAQAVYYGPVSNMDVEELLILKLNENSDKEAVESAMQARVDYQKTNFDGYGTDQMGLLGNAVIIVKGDYAALIISENSDKAGALYRKYLKGGT